MEKWQIELIKALETEESEEAARLADEWNQTDEKWMFVSELFCLSNDDYRVDYWVDRIESAFEAILDKTRSMPVLDQNAQCWMWMCGE